MSQGLLLDCLRLAAAGYLLVLATAACLGMHQALLAYPARASYAGLRLMLLTVTAGRVRISPLAKRAKRRQVRRLRSWQFALQEWRDRSQEEPVQEEQPRWQSAQKTVSAQTPAPAAVRAPSPVPAVPPPPAQLPEAPRAPVSHRPPPPTSPPAPAPPPPAIVDDDEADIQPPTF